jgi:ribose transport system substrate-binding protein
MNKFKEIIFLITIILVIISCNKDHSKNLRKLRYLYVPGVQDPFYQALERGIEEKAKELDVEVIFAPYPNVWSPEEQIKIMYESLLKVKNIDALLISPVANDGLIKPLKEIYQKGIEIITVDTYIGDGDYNQKSDYSFPLTYVGSDNEMGGKLMAEHLAFLIGGTGKIYCQSTNPDASSIYGRVKGFKEELSKYPNIELVNISWCLDDENVAQQQTLDALIKYPDIVGIFGVNVFSAQGAYKTVKNTGLSGAVKVASWDATPTLIKALENGEVDLVLAQKPSEMGSIAVELVTNYFKKKQIVPKRIYTGFVFFTRDNVFNPDIRKYIYE